MARRRFSLVLMGARGDAAKQKYLDRLKGIGQGENVGTKGGRPNSKELYIEPFSVDFPAGILVRTSALEPSWNAMSSAVSSRTRDTIVASAVKLKLSGFRAARVVRRTKDASGTKTSSKLTGLHYLKYNRTSMSVPFGSSGSGDTYSEAQTAITNAVKGSGNFSVTFIDERP